MPAGRLGSEYDPSAALVADASSVPDWSAFTTTPLTGPLSLARRTTPAILPAVENVKVIPLLAWAATVITTGPVDALPGTGTRMLVLDQLLGSAAMPLNVRVLETCVAPNPVPVNVT